MAYAVNTNMVLLFLCHHTVNKNDKYEHFKCPLNNPVHEVQQMWKDQVLCWSQTLHMNHNKNISLTTPYIKDTNRTAPWVTLHIYAIKLRTAFFKTHCTIFVLLLTKCHVFHNFISICLNNTYTLYKGCNECPNLSAKC